MDTRIDSLINLPTGGRVRELVVVPGSLCCVLCMKNRSSRKCNATHALLDREAKDKICNWKKRPVISLLIASVTHKLTVKCSFIWWESKLDAPHYIWFDTFMYTPSSAIWVIKKIYILQEEKRVGFFYIWMLRCAFLRYIFDRCREIAEQLTQEHRIRIWKMLFYSIFKLHVTLENICFKGSCISISMQADWLANENPIR